MPPTLVRLDKSSLTASKVSKPSPIASLTPPTTCKAVSAKKPLGSLSFSVATGSTGVGLAVTYLLELPAPQKASNSLAVSGLFCKYLISASVGIFIYFLLLV